MLKNLKKLRKETGTTQRQLAEAVAVSQQSINKYENHDIEPDIATLIRIADYFHTTVDHIIDHNECISSAEGALPAPLSAEELALVCDFRRLSPVEQQSIRLIMDNYCIHKGRRSQ